MRADRLIATLLLMQARGKVTAAELAAELEVSVATARRDLDALSIAGVPVYAERGRGGGWRLLGGARTDLSGLSSGEMRALFLLLGPAASQSPDASSALRKLVRALPESFRAQAQVAAQAVHVDPARWGADPVPVDGLRESLGAAITQRRAVRIDYTGRSGPPWQRLVHPWGLIDKAGRWDLIAGTPAGVRTYRLDRIHAATTTQETFQGPQALDLGAQWQAVSAHLHARRSSARAHVVAPAGLLEALRANLGPQHVEVTGDDASGGIRLEVTADTVEMLARQLCGWTPEVEVLGPSQVQAELGRRGRALTQRYGPA